MITFTSPKIVLIGIIIESKWNAESWRLDCPFVRDANTLKEETNRLEMVLVQPTFNTSAESWSWNSYFEEHVTVSQVFYNYRLLFEWLQVVRDNGYKSLDYSSIPLALFLAVFETMEHEFLQAGTPRKSCSAYGFHSNDH